MELRSSRSRSKTPLTQIESFTQEAVERGNHVEKTVTRSSRRTTVYRTNESASSSTDQMSAINVRPSRRSTRSEKAMRQLYRTSDYSSEEGENEVSSTRTISQNERNQLIEDAKAAANGNTEVSALDLYKKSGRYWDVYPKTDWTYSHHSKDRVELAPGVVAMPNMSRKTIHSIHGSEESAYSNVAHKETNTDVFNTKTNVYSSKAESYKPHSLFNNNIIDEYDIVEKVHTSRSFWSKTKRTVVYVFVSILTIFQYILEIQTPWFARLHQLTSRIMLMDTWLLWKTRSGNKSGKLIALCLLPLLLLGGWWILSSLGSLLYGAYLNSTLLASPTSQFAVQDEPVIIKNSELKQNELPIEQVSKSHDLPMAREFSDELSKESPPKDFVDIHKELNTEQIVEQILLTPHFQTIINNYNTLDAKENSFNSHINLIHTQQKIIDELKNEINKMKLDILDAEKARRDELHSMLSQLKAENIQNNARLSYEIKQCCRKSIINVEAYTSRILSNLLNDVEFLKSQKGLTDYLNTILIAKHDLESQLLNLTNYLNSKYDRLITENTQIIMNDVLQKIKLEFKQNERGVDVADLSDARIRQIVKTSLAIYDADKTGLVDYAMETMGGQVLTTRCTENYHYGKAVVSVLGIPLWYPVNSPRTIINPSINPGECWAFQSFPGFAVIKLSFPVKIEAFSLEHINKLLVPNRKIDSAPKHFEVYGLTSENDRYPVKLGEYTYDYDGEPLQFFPVQNEKHVFGIVELRVMSNHGNPNYTCLYRFRVHGTISQEQS